jgi:hypothetical protein
MATATSMAPKMGAGIARGAATFGVPAVAGVGGLLGGDVFGAYGLIQEWFPANVEANLPLSSKLDYTAAFTLLPYGIALVVVQILSGVVPGDGAWWHVLIFRSLRWFLIGIMVHELLAFVVPAHVTPTGGIVIPKAVQ